MEPRTTPLTPNSVLTVRALERAIRADLPPGEHGVSAKFLLREIHAGRLRAVRIGRWFRVRWADWLGWLEAQRVAPTVVNQATPRSDAAAWAAGKVANEEKRAAG